MKAMPIQDEVSPVSTSATTHTEATLHDLTWSDIGRFAEAMNLAQRELLSAARDLREEFNLGPRGTWIVGLIATGRIRTQSDVVKRYKVARSIIAEEMSQLVKSGLVISEQSRTDRRNVELTLTPLGNNVHARLGATLTSRMEQRLGGYTPRDVQFCTELLESLANVASVRP